jgi:hypothetical protein
MVKPPCKNCTERSISCHSTCEKYLSYREQLDKQKDLILQAREAQSDLYNFKSNGIKKVMRRKGIK